MGLEDAGYAVATASNAEEAIALLALDVAVVWAVVSDVNLAPDYLTGWDVARRARELATDPPIIYMSGASGHEWTSNGVPGSVLIFKTLAIGKIVTAISQLLNAGGASTAE